MGSELETVIVDGAPVDAAALFAELFNRALPLGIGALHYDPTPMSRVTARAVLDRAWQERWRASDREVRFDYVEGRSMKVAFVSGPEDASLTEQSRRLFDRDAGDGKFDEAARAARGPEMIGERR